jgi:hypothetical protein
MTAIKLNPDQQSAVNEMLDGFSDPNTKGFTLVGEGGTGKTTCIFSAVKVWLEQGKRILLTAPTNKAVKQLEKTAKEWGVFHHERIHICTVAKALGLALLPDAETKKSKRMGEGVVHLFDIMVMDESSMVSKYALFDYILPEVTQHGVKLICMGDDMQLPPVKEDSSPALEVFPKKSLTTVERFESGSGISKITTELRKKIKTNQPYSFTATDHPQLEVVKPAHFLQRVVDEFKANPNVQDTRALAWTNARVNTINFAVRTALYGADVPRLLEGEQVVTGAPVVDSFSGEVLLSTDQECIVKNVQISSLMDEATGTDYKTWMLTLESLHDDAAGTVFAHVIHEDAQKDLTAALNDIAMRAKAGNNNKLWWRYHQLKDMFSDVRYCYCITVHRSQGSSIPTVMVDVDDILKNHLRRERNRLLYVAYSRASSRLITCKERFVS